MACAALEPTQEAAAVKTQKYIVGALELEVPLAAVQQLPVPLQAATVRDV